MRPELKSANARLLDYVKNGGVLIVQYNLQDFDQNYGPYPFSLGDNPQKVVDEGSKVKLLEAGQSGLYVAESHHGERFCGWVEERGHGFMQSWDAQYEPLSRRPPIRNRIRSAADCCWRVTARAHTSTMRSRYTGSCPRASPGAFRILANLVSLGKNPAFIEQRAAK